MKKNNLHDVKTESAANKDRSKIRILVVDDQNFMRFFVQNILEQEVNFQIIDTANDGKDAVAKAISLQPDIVLIDLEMPGMDGVTAAAIITKKCPQCKILVLTSHEDSKHLEEALNAGAKGYILKNSSPEEIINAVRAIASGYSQLAPGLLEKVLLPKEPVPEARRDNLFSADSQTSVKHFRLLPKFLDSISITSALPLVVIASAVIIPVGLFTKVEQTITLRGKIVNNGETITVDAPVSGKVARVEIKQGEAITKGETLVQIKSPATKDRLQKQQQLLVRQQTQLTNLEFLKQQQQLSLRDRQQKNKARKIEKQALIEQIQQNLDSLKARHNGHTAEKSARLAETKKTIEEAQAKYQQALIDYRVAQKETNYDRETGEQSRVEAKITKRKALLDLAASAVTQAQSKYQQQQAYYNRLEQQISSEIKQAALQVQQQQKIYRSLVTDSDAITLESREYLQQTESKITKLQQQIKSNQNSIERLQLQLQQQIVESPLNGIVSQLKIQKIGTKVQKGEMLAQIVPQEEPLVLQAKTRKKQQDLLKVGLPATVNVRTNSMSYSDSVSGNLSSVTSSEDKTKNSAVYQNIEIELEKNYLQKQNQKLFLTPGQAATAKIKVGQNRLIDIFLAHWANRN